MCALARTLEKTDGADRYEQRRAGFELSYKRKYVKDARS